MFILTDLFALTKSALNTQQPDEVICRDAEIEHINSFLNSHIRKRRAGSLYISGAPGTGKTAVIKHLLNERNEVSFIIIIRVGSQASLLL